MRILVGLMSLALAACAQQHPAKVPVDGYRVVNTYPHDRAAFTQGLVYLDGVLYESTGLNGKSTLRSVELASGRVLQNRPVSAEYFAEGLAYLDNKLFQLTWQTGVAFVYDRMSFRPLATLKYPGEGWGLTTDGRQLILSDGSANLRFLDPATFREVRRMQVTDGGRPVTQLNELEWVKGEIYANVWQTDRLVRISPTTGKVLGWIDLAGLLSDSERYAGVDVLNGIAYDAKGDRLFVTGKWWPKLFEIKLVKR